jgi:hypothetical protein
MTKLSYSTPKLQVYGRVEELTRTFKCPSPTNKGFNGSADTQWAGVWGYVANQIGYGDCPSLS